MELGSNIAFFIAAFSALLTIVNPFSTAPIFLSITAGNTAKQRLRMAKRASITAFVVLLLFALVGNYILSFFSITLDAFRIAGGIFIAAVGWGMLHQGKQHFRNKQEHEEAIRKDDVSITPIAIPSLCGPGAITTAIFLMEDANSITQGSLVLLAILAVGIITYFTLSRAHNLRAHLNENMRHIIDKIMGLIVLVVGTQFVINGIMSLLHL